jgi:thiaminase/transcriptional activator TenA
MPEPAALFDNTLFARLRQACAVEWRAYCEHEFVRRLGDGSLPEACFRHYLGQDYLFLIHFARAYGLAVYKADDLAAMRQAAATVSALVDVEMGLHVEFCAGWGLSEAEMEALPEATATMAYTRYVLERGLAGDILDLQVALAPCVVGYGEIGQRLEADPATRLEDNPYRAWIEMYAGADYQALARSAVDELERLAERRLSAPRFDDLARTFAQATRLETAFWDMGLGLLR